MDECQSGDSDWANCPVHVRKRRPDLVYDHVQDLERQTMKQIDLEHLADIIEIAQRNASRVEKRFIAAFVAEINAPDDTLPVAPPEPALDTPTPPALP